MSLMPGGVGGWLGVRLGPGAQGAPPTLTDTFIGFGDAANELTGDANLTWINGTGVVGINRVAGQTADADFLQYDGLVTDEAVQAGIRWTVDGSEASIRAEWTGVTGNVADGFQLRYTAPDHFFQSTNAASASTAIHVVTAASEYIIGLVGGVNQLLVPTDSGALAEVDIAKSGDINTGLLWSAADELQAVAAGGAAMTWDATNTTVERGQLFVQGGTFTLPGLVIGANADTGLFEVSADRIGVALGGNSSYRFKTTGFEILGSRQLHAAVGTVLAPGISYASDINSGDFRIGGDEIGRATGGVLRMAWDAAGSVVMGTGVLATTATDGYFYATTCAGVPTGVPTAKTGRTPLQYDSTNKDLYVFDVGDAAWQKIGPSFDSITKTFGHADFTEAVNNVETVAFDDAIPAGAVVVNVEYSCGTSFSGGSANGVTASVQNSGWTNTTTGIGAGTLTGAPSLFAGAPFFISTFGNILAGDTPVLALDVSADVPDNLDAGSVIVTIHFYVP